MKVLRTISTLILRVLMWLETESVSYVYLPEPNVHGCVLANGGLKMTAYYVHHQMVEAVCTFET
jgi:hypothetical protein